MQASEKKIWTVGEILKTVTNFLDDRNCETPRLNAEVLLAHILGLKRIALYTGYNRPLLPVELDSYRELVRRRAAGEPSAYLVGHKEFYSLEFEVGFGVLIPRPETEFLAATAIEEAKKWQNAMAADLGTGSGCVAVALAVYASKCEVIATEKSAEALNYAVRNAALHDVHERVTVVEGDFFEPLERMGLAEKLDIIISNPPYVSEAEFDKLPVTVRKYEPREALVSGVNGTECHRFIVERAPEFLKPGGLLAMELGDGQYEEVEGFVLESDAFVESWPVNDYNGIGRIIAAIRKKNMDKFVIEGGKKLKGKVSVSGAKNAALPIMAATLLVDGVVALRNVPELRDINSIADILRVLGMRVERTANETVELEAKDLSKVEAPYELVSTLRASICALGPLLARRGRARVSMPGGCVIGVRPIDLHLKGLRALGAKIEIKHGYIEARASRLKGAEIYLGGPYGSSVLGTANVMMAATLAEGETVIENAACEPEIQDLAHFLNRCGARIEGIGRPILIIRGVKKLHGAKYRVIPDRIEAGTFIIAGAITGSRIKVTNARARHLSAFLDKLREAGVEFAIKGRSIEVIPPKRPKAVDLITLPYPGYPTDLQAQIMAYLSRADGISLITEKIYPDRFMHVAELSRMGAEIRKEGSSAIVHGTHHLSGAPVMASDLRASAALVLAGLVAEGRTEIARVYHIDRGYNRIEEKLNLLGARIERVSEEYPVKAPE